MVLIDSLVFITTHKLLQKADNNIYINYFLAVQSHFAFVIGIGTSIT